MLGLRRHTVTLRPHDAQWSEEAAEQIGRIVAAANLPSERVQHVGSTAVAGLLAKPIIDIDIGLVEGEDVEAVASALVTLGFIDRGDHEGGIGRLLVWETSPEVRTVHIHVIPFDSDGWRRDLLFRDALREDVALRSRYAEVKKELAARHGSSRAAYRHGKGPFIEATLDRLESLSSDTILKGQIAYYRARAPEYDQWMRREGRYNKGEEHTARWQTETEMARRLLHRVPFEGRVLEIACGTGIWTAELVSHDVRVMAVDTSPEALELNRTRVGSARVEYVEADIFKWRPPSPFDAIVFMFWLSHVPPDRFDEFWDRVEESIAPGGRVFFLDNKWYPEYRWPQGVNDGGQPAGESPWIVTRELNDGRRFEIVKVFYDAPELAGRLHRRGWTGEVDETPEFFLWGDLRRSA